MEKKKLYGTRMVNEMRFNHELGILETLVLGRAFLGAEFGKNRDPREFVLARFRTFSPVFTEDTRIEFMCHCNRERLRGLLTMLPADELRDIAENGPFPVELRCHFCSTRYEFSRENIWKIYGQRYPGN